SDINPRLSYCLKPLVVPNIHPPHWVLWREDFIELSLCLVEVRLTWIEDEAPPPCIERLELQFIQAWRTNVEGELLAFLFGTVRPGHQDLITKELTIPVAQLADDLPVDIISQDDAHPVPHVLSRTLTPYLQWSTCVEGAAERIPPSQQQYLDHRTARDPAFFRHPTAEQLAAIREEEEEEESTGSDEDVREESENSDEELGEEDETPGEGSYSEHSEGEQSEEEEEDEEGEEEHEDEPAGSKWEAVSEEELRMGMEAENPEAAREREEPAAGKRTPWRFEAETDGLGIKIATKEVPWQDVCDGITPEGHVAIREEDAQMMTTVFSWQSDHSFISAPPPDLAKQANTKQIDVRIWDQLFELHIPQYVSDEIHRVIVDILTEYQGAISVSDTDIRLSLVIQHEIQTGNHSPIHCKPYRYSLIERKKVLERIREFEASGWIELATGPWSFPVVLVLKKNGAIRICIDYRKLNEITIKDVYPLPQIDDLLDAIGCANYFSKFDIRHDFHHILVREEDRLQMAFVLFAGTWKWVRCPMGIWNAPATFQRAMNMTFHNFVNKTRLTQGMINFCVIVYMDDILVYSETYHGHAQHIEWTLGALRDAGFKIALEKSEFFPSEISFLGYVVTRGGLRPDSRKVEAMKEAPVPTSLTQVRTFLGLASYNRRFIKGFVAIARPLTNLLQKDQPLSWDAKCQQAFATLKDALVTTPILIRPDPSKQFILITDWQPEVIFAILAQKGNDGREHVIEYALRTVPDERRNDSAPQGECYAVVWGIQHFHPYLYRQKFRLVTDHEPLLALKKLTNYTGKIGRWAVRLQEYDFDIVHRKTERHGNADGLTRLHRPAKVSSVLLILLGFVSQKEMPRYQAFSPRSADFGSRDDPWRWLASLGDDVFEKLDEPSRSYVRDSQAMAKTAVDVKETPTSYEFVADLPGLSREGVKVQVEDGNKLVISGERHREPRKERREAGEKYHRVERRMGKFMRRFTLPEDADVNKIGAQCKDGVLTVTVARVEAKEPEKPKVIDVEVS
ncbi:hypothetical protein CBR_g52560, partial [Chara braunii]